MKKIELISIDRENLDLIRSDLVRFLKARSLLMDTDREAFLDVIGQTTQVMSATGGAPKWFAYLVIDPEEKAVVGTCAFKGPPDAERNVELAYYTFPEVEGRGYATAMAAALVNIAASSPGVDHIRAHTLPMENASTRILVKAGMKFVGEVMDPDDGRAWRWCLDTAHVSSRLHPPQIVE